MNLPGWIGEYPGLQERLEVIVGRMKIYYSGKAIPPLVKNSEIVKEARYLLKKTEELEDKTYDLLSDSFWACMPQAKHDERGNPLEYMSALGNSFLTIRNQLKAIGEIHANVSSNMKGRTENMFINYIVRAAIECGLEVNKKNAKRFTLLVDYCYINADIDFPDNIDSLLSKIKRENRKKPIEK